MTIKYREGFKIMEKKSKSIKTVTILLTKYSDFWGRIIRGINGEGYSHASISMDEEEEIFYSFNFKGFAIEKPKKRKPKKQAPGNACIRIQVPESIYAIIQEEINEFLEDVEKYRYTKLGLVLCILRIPHKFKNQYFCSQFVAEVLSRAGAIKLKKNESLYLPSHFIDGFECLFSKKQLVYNAI